MSTLIQSLTQDVSSCDIILLEGVVAFGDRLDWVISDNSFDNVGCCWASMVEVLSGSGHDSGILIGATS